MKCPSCHSENPASMAKCLRCGAAMPDIRLELEKSYTQQLQIALIGFAIYLAFTKGFWMLMPLLLSKFGMPGRSMQQFYLWTSGFFTIIEIALLLYCGIKYRHTLGKVLFFGIAALLVILFIAGTVFSNAY